MNHAWDKEKTRARECNLTLNQTGQERAAVVEILVFKTIKSESPQKPLWQNNLAFVYLVLSYCPTWDRAILPLFTVKSTQTHTHTSSPAYINICLWIFSGTTWAFLSLLENWEPNSLILECLRFFSPICDFILHLVPFLICLVGRWTCGVISIKCRAFTPRCLPIRWPQFSCLHFSKICWECVHSTVEGCVLSGRLARVFGCNAFEK